VIEALRRRAPYAAIAATIVACDQLSKWLIDRTLELHASRTLIEGLLSLTYVRNRGAAFGVLSEADLPYQALLFAAISVVALAAIAFYAFRVPATQRLPQVALALVMGGALGNLLDRAALGYVRDFVDVYWRHHHWPAFNVADSAISVGVCLLVIDLLRGSEAAAERPMAQAAPGRGE
jgi:signal peptidase II